MIGAQLTHYQITARLGQGGMGEVYRARDTKLGREVAIKVLPKSFTSLPESAARFEREAKALATLNHPGIASIYGFDIANGIHFLVMELVEGETLEERLKRGALPLDEALDIARQIAEALEAAHERGIIHRDLKPANLKITPEGRVKVLDFGLAKAMVNASSDAALADSPTILGSIEGTLPGVILGTAAYMSPEQARGKPADHRSDIWSFGVVLFECLTGRQVFQGESLSDILAAVLHQEVNWSLLPPSTPIQARWLLRKCLARDKKARVQSIADARVDLDPSNLSADLFSSALPAKSPAQVMRSTWLLLLPWLLLLVFAGFAYRKVSSPAPELAPRAESLPQTYTLALAPGAPLTTLFPAGSSILLSGDGSKVVYLGLTNGYHELYWKNVQESGFKVIPQSIKATCVAAFEPNNERLAYWNTDGELKIFSFQGGLPRSLGRDGPLVLGASWAKPGKLLYTTKNGLALIDPDGPGSPELLLAADQTRGEMFRNPRLLPGGKTILFEVDSTNRVPSLEAFDLARKTRQPIGLTGSYNFEFFSATGHLLYGRDDVLWAKPFNPATLEFLGAEIPLLKDAGRDWNKGTHQFAIASNGTLIYGRGHQTDPRQELVWVRSHGQPEVLPVPPGDYRFPRVSPAGDAVLLQKAESLNVRADLTTGLAVSLGVNDAWAALGPYGLYAGAAFGFDGTYAYFNRIEDSKLSVVRTQVDGLEKPKMIYRSAVSVYEERMVGRAVSRDGKYLALQTVGDVRGDIFLKDLKSDSPPQPFANTPRHEVAPAFSPDGQWLAYTAMLTDRFEIYVRSVSEQGRPVQVSRNGGAGPVWSPDGTSLYYFARDIMVAKLKSIKPLAFETPALFASGRFSRAGSDPGANFDVASDNGGDRVLLLRSIYQEPEPQGATELTVIVHFDEYLRQQAKLTHSNK